MKRINLDKISKNQLLDWCKSYAESKTIQVVINNNTQGFCYAYPHDRIISLNTQVFSKKKLAFAFFHEMGHFHIWENHLFHKHFEKPSIRVEQYCDNFGEKEAKRFFTNPDCYKPYHKKHGVLYIKERNTLGNDIAVKNLFKRVKLYNKIERLNKNHFNDNKN